MDSIKKVYITQFYAKGESLVVRYKLICILIVRGDNLLIIIFSMTGSESFFLLYVNVDGHIMLIK